MIPTERATRCELPHIPQTRLGITRRFASVKFIASRRVDYSNNYIEGELISRFAGHVRTIYM